MSGDRLGGRNDEGLGCAPPTGFRQSGACTCACDRNLRAYSSPIWTRLDYRRCATKSPAPCCFSAMKLVALDERPWTSPTCALPIDTDSPAPPGLMAPPRLGTSLTLNAPAIERPGMGRRICRRSATLYLINVCHSRGAARRCRSCLVGQRIRSGATSPARCDRADVSTLRNVEQTAGARFRSADKHRRPYSLRPV